MKKEGCICLNQDIGRNAMVLEYRIKARKMARSILNKWHSRFEEEEINSIVDLSLCEAVSRFDESRGASFITFMFYHLRGNLIRAITAATNDSVVSVVDAKEIQLRESLQGGMLNQMEAISAVEALSGIDPVYPDTALIKKELWQASIAACNKLDKLEREVIYRLYIKEQQVTDIAESLGYSRCHISRVKSHALECLRSILGIDQGELNVQEGKELILTPEVRRRQPRSKRNRELQQIQLRKAA